MKNITNELQEMIELEKEIKEKTKKIDSFKRKVNIKKNQTLLNYLMVEQAAKQLMSDDQLTNQLIFQCIENHAEIACSAFENNTFNYLRDYALNILVNQYPDKLLNLVLSRSFRFNEDELNFIYKKLHNHYIELIHKSPKKLYSYYRVFKKYPCRDVEELLAKRMNAANNQHIAVLLLDDPNYPEDLKEQINASMLMLSLKGKKQW